MQRSVMGNARALTVLGAVGLVGCLATPGAAATRTLQPPAASLVASRPNVTLTTTLEAPVRWWPSGTFQRFLSLQAPGRPITITLASSDGTHQATARPIRTSYCRKVPERHLGLAGYQWCLQVIGLVPGTTVTGTTQTPGLRLTLTLEPRDQLFPLPLLAAILGLLIAVIVVVFEAKQLNQSGWRTVKFLWLGEVAGVVIIVMIIATASALSATYLAATSFGSWTDYLKLFVTAFGSSTLTGALSTLLIQVPAGSK
jgi:hypothetical protein